MAHLDHQGSYPRVLLVFFGIADVTFVRAENPARSAVREKSVGNARAAIASLFA